MAMLDAILASEWGSRYYSFNAHWAKGKQMASMRDGSGDDFFALFSKAGCFLKGFAHEAPMSPYRTQPNSLWPGIFEQVPREFAAGLREPAFAIDDATFCIWRNYKSPAWQVGAIEFPPGNDPDGSQGLLSPLDGKPQTYQKWATDYYEATVKLAAVKKIYAHQPLTEKLVQALNPDSSLADLAEDIKEIGYPEA